MPRCWQQYDDAGQGFFCPHEPKETEKTAETGPPKNNVVGLKSNFHIPQGFPVDPATVADAKRLYEMVASGEVVSFTSVCLHRDETTSSCSSGAVSSRSYLGLMAICFQQQVQKYIDK